ncbi:hypothetical protein GCM10010199_35180 [Dactylosporangium roseum]
MTVAVVAIAVLRNITAVAHHVSPVPLGKIDTLGHPCGLERKSGARPAYGAPPNGAMALGRVVGLVTPDRAPKDQKSVNPAK